MPNDTTVVDAHSLLQIRDWQPFLLCMRRSNNHMWCRPFCSSYTGADPELILWGGPARVMMSRERPTYLHIIIRAARCDFILARKTQ